jgi:hypothetical protein
MTSLDLDFINIMHKQYTAVLEMELRILRAKPTELRALIGRIGEFHCAIQVKGSLTAGANTRGYDVVAENGRRISVKTTSQTSGFVSIRKSTMHLADDLMIVQYAEGQFKTILHCVMADVTAHCRTWKDNFELDIKKAARLASQF